MTYHVFFEVLFREKESSIAMNLRVSLKKKMILKLVFHVQLIHGHLLHIILRKREFYIGKMRIIILLTVQLSKILMKQFLYATIHLQKT